MDRNRFVDVYRFFHRFPVTSPFRLMGLNPFFHFQVPGHGGGQKNFAAAGNRIGGIQSKPAFAASASADYQCDQGSVIQNNQFLSFCVNRLNRHRIPYP
jgi:hypothetical protein